VLARDTHRAYKCANQAEPSEKPKFEGKRVHFIGIGGIGMSGIASILIKQGYRISGSDLKESALTRKLSQEGIVIFKGHDALHLGNAETVVYSSAITEDNPELVAAKAKGLFIMRRAQALAGLMQDKICIAVSGAHGKTTTTALASHLLMHCGFCPTVAIGGILRNLDDNCCVGKSDYFVAEADESDGTFLYYRPTYAIVTNIDKEHLDFYHSWQDILNAYTNFIAHIKSAGWLLCCGDDPALRQITQGYQKQIAYFGLLPDNDFSAREIHLNDFSSSFTYCYKGEALGKATIALSGKHNVSNALAVIALGRHLGISLENIEAGLAAFKGTERRFELKYDSNGIKIIDDYGHHPSEIKATIEAAKNIAHKRIIVIFQPHRYSRTKFLMEEFTGCFQSADCLILTDIYAASERPLSGVSSEALAHAIKERFTDLDVVYLKKEHIIDYILRIAQKADVILTLGAGDIGKVSDELVQRFKRQNTF